MSDGQLREAVYRAIASNPGVTYRELAESFPDIVKLNTAVLRLIGDGRIRSEWPNPRTMKYFPASGTRTDSP